MSHTGRFVDSIIEDFNNNCRTCQNEGWHFRGGEGEDRGQCIACEVCCGVGRLGVMVTLDAFLPGLREHARRAEAVGDFKLALLIVKFAHAVDDHCPPEDVACDDPDYLEGLVNLHSGARRN